MHELKFTGLRFDDEIFEVLVQAVNDSFSGEVRVSIFYEECLELISRLNGFPKAISDEIEFQFSDDLNHTDLGLKFYCRDNLGNPSVSVSLRQLEI